MSESIDITPDWATLVPLFVNVLQNPKASQDSKDAIEAELMRLAEFADKTNRCSITTSPQ